MRIHKVMIYYFLEDKSIMIIEPKEENSGMPQGAFLKRQMVLRGDGMTPFMPQDFRVGLDVGIHGRAIRITDCDDYTRAFFDVSLIWQLRELFFGCDKIITLYLEPWCSSGPCLGSAHGSVPHLQDP
jgi:hypothetical protein